jgi:hypothetical protein
MKSFSFNVLYSSIFAPSILYVLSLPYLEMYLQHRLAHTLRQGLVQHDFELLQGQVSLYDEVSRNVSEMLRRSPAVRFGAEVGVRVTDAYENVVYPHYEHLLSPLQDGHRTARRPGPLFDEHGHALVDPAAKGVESFLQAYSDYMRGMKVTVQAKIPVTSWLGSGLLLLFILMTVVFLYLYYQRSSVLDEKRIRQITEELETEKRTASHVEAELEAAKAQLASVRSQEEEWLREVERLEREKGTLEEELLDTLERSEEQQERIDALQEKVVRTGERKGRAAKAENVIAARFERLYRNLELDRKALGDFVRLGDEKAKLQAEETLKRLNDGDPNLKVRRKIAGVEKCDAYELGFGASGRIYHYLSAGRRYRVLRIGTKASQSKDLAYLQGRARS